jgi:hypothetical protein
MNESIASELLATGNRLWSSVECDTTRGCVVVYARLCTSAVPNLHGALLESERVLTTVMERHLGSRGWLAAVQWSERLCRTIGPCVTRASHVTSEDPPHA